MKIIDKLKQAIKAFNGTDSNNATSIFNLNNGSSPRQYVENDLLNGYAGWAYAAISKRAKRVGAMEWELYEYTKGGDVQELHDHPLLTLLFKPNRLQSRYEFLYTLELFICIWGRAPIHIERMGDRPVALWPIRPDLLKKEKDDAGNLKRYTYRVNGVIQYFQPEEVFEIHEPNPKSLAGGFSALTASALEIDTDVAAATWNRFLLENGGESSVILETDKILSEKTYKRVNQQWNQRQAGPMNAGKTPILEDGLKAVSVGKSIADMALNDTRRFNRGAIVTILGVPEPLLTSENSNLANVEGSERVFNQDTINPEMRLINDAFNEFFVVLFGDNLCLEYESPIKENVQDKINVAVAGEGRWLTVNEARDMFNLPPLVGGDDVYKPMGVVPTVGGLQKPAAGEKYLQLTADPSKKTNPKHERVKKIILARTYTKRAFIAGVEQRVAARLAELYKGKATITLKVADPIKKKDIETAPELDPRLKAERLEFLKALPKYEKNYRDQLNKFFDKLKKEVFANLESEGLPKGLKANTNWVSRLLFDKDKANAGLITISGAVWRENINRGANAVADLMGKPPIEDFTTPFVIKFIKEREVKIKMVTDTTEAKLRVALTEGITAGETTGQIRTRIEGVFEIAQGVQSETIARTEVASAQNFGRMEEMRVAGAKNKIWIAIFNNTRTDHENAHGQIVGVNDPFDVGGEDLQFPGDPNGSAWNVINCQCSSSPTLEDITG